MSMGLVSLLETTPNLTELLKNADVACYMAKEMGRNQRYRPTINKRRGTKDWRDLGALKAELLDMTILERNKHAKAVVLDIEAQRSEGLGVITIRPGLGAQRKEAAR